ncbi:MAG TPA: MBL fold metallo-hydrolase, partial [bacterium]|nr:MBL fold metallo-hydrolase [bacterium]
LEDVLAHAMVPPFFPISMEDMGAQKLIQNISERNQVIIAGQDAPPQIINKATDKRPLTSEAVVVGAMKDYNHPRDGVLIYSVEYEGKRVVIATDVEGYIGGDQKLIGFAHGADLLIHDAQYTYEVYADGKYPKQGWGHSTVEMAAEVAQKAQVKQLALTHHDPLDTDRMVDLKELHAQKLFKNTFAAYEGLTVTL